MQVRARQTGGSKLFQIQDWGDSIFLRGNVRKGKDRKFLKIVMLIVNWSVSKSKGEP